MRSSPFELRCPGTGAGLFVGCGVGAGVVAPVSLHAIPVLGQLAASLSSSLGSLNHASGGVATAARRQVQALGARAGVRGADLGFGCGVMLGYGWGAGLMLKPTTLQSLNQTVQNAGQRLAARLPPPLQAALQQRHAGTAAAAAAGGPSQLGALGVAGSSSSSLLVDPGLPPSQLLHTQPEARGLEGPAAGPSSSPAAAPTHTPATTSSTQQLERELSELSRLVVKQQNALGDLQQQVSALQATVCKLDAGAPGCKPRR